MELKPGFKETEIGMLPEDWATPTLATLFSIKNGLNKAKVYFGHGTPIVNYMDVFTSSGLLASDLQGRVEVSNAELEAYNVRHGDVFFTRTSETVEEVGIASVVLDDQIDTVFSGFILRARPMGDTLIDDFKRYCFSSRVVRRQIISKSTYTTRALINGRALGDVILPIPSNQSEQRSIANALGDADALIAALTLLLAKKRDLKTGAMQQLLSGKKRLPGFGGTWPEAQLRDLFNFSGGFSASRDLLSAHGFCYLHYGDIHKSAKTFIDLQSDNLDIPKLDIPLSKISTASLLGDGDIVFVDASEDIEGTSKHVVISNPYKIPFISGLHTIVAKQKIGALNPLYLRYCFQTSAIKSQFRFFAVGTKVSGISKSNIARISLPVPSLSEQAAIADVLSDIDADIIALETKLAKVRNLRRGMMQVLLTGQIRLLPVSARVTQLMPQQKAITTDGKPHNQQINEAVVIGVLSCRFGSAQFPLGRKRRTKLSYLLHRYADHEVDGFLKKAAGPYNPGARYGGPEKIALKNNYVHERRDGKYTGFVAGDKVADAERYFEKWYGAKVLSWLDQFRHKTNDDLELITTVDMASEELRREGRVVNLDNVKHVIESDPEWLPKLDRSLFSDGNIKATIQSCQRLFGTAKG